MKGVHLMGGRVMRFGGRKAPEAVAKCEIGVQFLTFSCRKFRI